MRPGSGSLATLAVVAAGMIACGDSEQPSTDEPTKPVDEAKAKPSKPVPTAKDGKFKGDAANTYDEAKVVCGSAPPDKVARDLGINVNVHSAEGLLSIAERYARGYDAKRHQAALEGCFDGLPNP